MKIKVFIAGYFVDLLLLLEVSAVWLFIILNGGIKKLDIFTWVFLGVFTIALPMFLIIWISLTMTNTIAFDETGVSRIRFGKTIRHINWTDVKSFSSTADNSFTGWIYLSDVERKFDNSILSIAKMRLDRRVIYFHQSKKAQEAIDKYMPDFCKEKFLKPKLNLHVL